MIVSRCLLALLLLGVAPAFAETGVLELPRPGTRHDGEYTRPAHPRADPVTPVEQVGPSETHHAHHPRPTPVVRAHGNTHAEKPAHLAHETVKPPPKKRAPEAVPRPAEPDKGSVTGLPIPRFAALRSDEVNLRVGPGMRFPIEWQYHRRELPMEILREVDVWRLVEDQDGVKGWVHQATLTGRRGFVVKGQEATLRRAAEATAGAVAILKPGVVGRIRHCAAGSDWCDVQVGDYHGWLQRERFWGTFSGEAVN